MEQLDFFIGSQTPGRYISHLEEYKGQTWQVISLRSLPGSGKSDAIKKAVKQLNEAREIWHCSCDLESIDGALFPEKRTLVLDSEWPHAFFSSYPLVAHTEFEFYSCIDRTLILPQSDNLCFLIQKKKARFKECQSCLQGMRTLMQDGYFLLLPYINTKKIARFARKVAAREFEKQPHLAKENPRFLSAFTKDGYLSFYQTISKLCDRVYVFYDKFPCLQRLTLHAIRSFLVEYGYEFYACYSPLGPFDFLEHILVPDLRLGFITLQNKSQAKKFNLAGTVSFSRFLRPSKIREAKRGLSKSFEKFGALQQEATNCLKDAFNFHEQAMEIYGSCIDMQAYQAKMIEFEKRLDSLANGGLF